MCATVLSVRACANGRNWKQTTDQQWSCSSACVCVCVFELLVHRAERECFFGVRNTRVDNARLGLSDKSGPKYKEAKREAGQRREKERGRGKGARCVSRLKGRLQWAGGFFF